MNLKNKKGITLIDVAVSIVIITIFTAINMAILYNTYISSMETDRNNKAIQKLVQEVEQIKQKPFDDVVSTNEVQENGIWWSVSVQDYKNKGILKKVTVTVRYEMFKGKDEQKNNTFTITTLKAK